MCSLSWRRLVVGLSRHYSQGIFSRLDSSALVVEASGRLTAVRSSYCHNNGANSSSSSSSSSMEGDEEETTRTGKEIQAVTSSLRVDAVAAIGLNISRKMMWELSLEGLISLNGSKLDKKSTQVKEGDIIEVDSILKNRKEEAAEPIVKRGRVVVKEIGPLTRKGKYRLSLIRHKHFKLTKSSQ